MPEVSVVIPAYNAQDTLAGTLVSVLGQTFADFEAIVINDGSVDATAEIARGMSDERIRVSSVVNGGVARARNRGVQEAGGRFVAFLDADDLWEPTKLARQIELLNARPDVGMCFTAATRVDTLGRPTAPIPARDYTNYCRALLLYSVIVPAACSSMMVRRALALEVDGFDPTFSQTADWDYLLRLSQMTQFAPICEPLVRYRTHAANMSSNIGLLERDTFAVLEKFFADPRSASYLPLRPRVYSNHWMICSGSYLHTGQVTSSVRCLIRGLRAYPRNASRPLGLPGRWAARLTGASGTNP